MEKTTKKLIAEEKDMRILLSKHCSDRTRECCLNCTYRDRCSIVKTLRTQPSISFDDSIYDLRLKCDDFELSSELVDDNLYNFS
jgi:hypothetical protein